MGLRSSYPDYQGDFMAQNWQQIPVVSYSNPAHGKFRRLCNNMTRELLDEFQVCCMNKDDFKDYMEWFQVRNSHECLVQAKYLVYEGAKSLCTSHFRIKVYIQNMGARLADIKDVPFPENLYIVQAALRGFYFLFEQVGYFSISEDLICMNQEGNVKVWLHSDFSSTRPFRLPTTEPTQSAMVKEIIQIIHVNTDPQYNAIPIPQYFAQAQQKQLTFQYALQLLQEYAAHHNVEIPTYFETIVEKIREDQGIECSSQSDTKRGNYLSMGNQWIRESAGYFITSNMFKSQSSKTYADQLKGFDSQVLLGFHSKRSDVESGVPVRKSCFTDRIMEEKKQGDSFRRHSNAHRSHTHSPPTSHSDEHTKAKPPITFTYQEQSSLQKQNMKKSSFYSQKHHNEDSCNLPISPQSEEFTFKKDNQRKMQILECGVELDPQIVQDLLRYA